MNTIPLLFVEPREWCPERERKRERGGASASVFPAYPFVSKGVA